MKTQFTSSLKPGLLALAALLAALPASQAPAADNATASATAVVLQPIAVAQAADLVFGSLIAGNGAVTVSTDGTRTSAGGTTPMPSSGATPTAARFDVTGTGAATFSIDYTGSDTVLTSGGNTMAIDWITESLTLATGSGKTDPNTDATTGTLSGGAAYIFVGAKLTVGAGQAAGTYTGIVKVTVAYN
ncbi:DUF4402 domain-containing protein [Pelomonas sp. SE-A7]|uniref:DUF4402 domain-containing protein n=1 Tax=Pelomonas sp. SE-A7 TaxID=3054953 RepID=UPI00259D0ADA|nr:DUF4402 domain-containing protein [Pelomonas sp. SE-A7]MDM4764964.1 DUF4402 domain-containing protein [Pelomonas sp. SE-A7]